MYIKEKYKMMEDKKMDLSRESIKEIIKQGMEEYRKSGWLIEEKIIPHYRGRDSNYLIAGLICCNYSGKKLTKAYKDTGVKLEAEVKQLKEDLKNMNNYNRHLMERVKQLENDCNILRGRENSANKNLSYREDVDIKTITSLLQKGYSKSEVAKKLGVSRQTIYRRLEEKGK